jgi:hypothetical protein
MNSVSTNQEPSRARIVCLTALGVFILACLFPPWLYTFDLNGRGGGHSRKPAGYYFIATPPQPEEPPQTSPLPSQANDPDFVEYAKQSKANAKKYYGVQIDFIRLTIEWAALAAVTGMVWVFVVKPPWLRDDKANRPQKFIPPTGNQKN